MLAGGERERSEAGRGGVPSRALPRGGSAGDRARKSRLYAQKFVGVRADDVRRWRETAAAGVADAHRPGELPRDEVSAADSSDLVMTPS